LHWRTKNGTDIAANWDAYYRLIAPSTQAATPSSHELWSAHVVGRYGPEAASSLVPLLMRAEQEGWLTAASAEFEPYTPANGRLSPAALEGTQKLRMAIASCLSGSTTPQHMSELKSLWSTVDFVLLLHEVGLAMAPAAQLRAAVIVGDASSDTVLAKNCSAAMAEFSGAPFEGLFSVFTARVRSRGELGMLSAINQKLWRYKLLLEAWLNAGCPTAR
jgi:hypothetical protein